MDETRPNSAYWNLLWETHHKRQAVRLAREKNARPLHLVNGDAWVMKCPRCQENTLIFNHKRYACLGNCFTSGSFAELLEMVHPVRIVEPAGAEPTPIQEG